MRNQEMKNKQKVMKINIKYIKINNGIKRQKN